MIFRIKFRKCLRQREQTQPKVPWSSLLFLAALGGAGIGAAAGITAAMLTGFPGLGLAMVVYGGLAGAAYGGVDGVDHATSDDSVNLPKLEKYESRVAEGMKLLVVRGSHDRIQVARESILNTPHLAVHIHKQREHDFHEHTPVNS